MGLIAALAMLAAPTSLPAQEPEAGGEGEPPAPQVEPPGEDAPQIQIESFADGFTAPVYLADPDDGSGRLFVVDQDGQIFVLDAEGEARAEPFLEVEDQLVELEPEYDERGLLGLAFHPEFAENGRFFVYYSAPLRDEGPEDWDHTSHLSEFLVDPDDPDRADPESERLVLAVDQPYSNHNAGQIAFGEDGMLYVPLGDGGNGGDIDAEGDELGRPDIGHAQETENLLGAVLRIDVDGERPYAVPADNPLVGEDGRDEIWAYGFRNPYGFLPDLESGDFYVADAGQARIEELNRLERGGNFGWNIKEGTTCFDPDNFLEEPPSCPDVGADGEPLIDPILEYPRSPETGSVIVPGIRYRGAALPEHQGDLLFGDDGRIRFLPGRRRLRGQRAGGRRGDVDGRGGAGQRRRRRQRRRGPQSVPARGHAGRGRRGLPDDDRQRRPAS